jgi:TPP-dependent pyruvate/acetoin dehydrogenase alpha subunit
MVSWNLDDLENHGLNFYRRMLVIRFFEQKCEHGFARNQIAGTTHLCIGQEAVPVGVSVFLEKNDYVVSTHRGHGHALCKGLTAHGLFAEILGKATGYCGGKGGTQHVANLAVGFLGTNGVTGGGLPIATGAALSQKLSSTRNIAVSFLGEGATNQGTFSESLNMAGLWNLPVLFVCENNGYAMSTAAHRASQGTAIHKKAEALGVAGYHVDGMDVLEVARLARELIERMRAGGGPALIEAVTYRFGGHSKSDPRMYRTREEEKLWKGRCPIDRLRGQLLDRQITDATTLKAIRKEVKTEIESAYQRAMADPFPEEGRALEDVFFER